VPRSTSTIIRAGQLLAEEKSAQPIPAAKGADLQAILMPEEGLEPGVDESGLLPASRREQIRGTRRGWLLPEASQEHR
jgi:hypothetical protein